MAKRRETTYGLCRNLDGLVLPVTSERDWEQIQRGAAGAGRFLIVHIVSARDRPYYNPIFVADADAAVAEVASIMRTEQGLDDVEAVWDTWGAEEYVPPPPPERRSPWPWRRRAS